MHRIRQILLLLSVVAPVHLTEELLFRDAEGMTIALTVAGLGALLLGSGLIASGTLRLIAGSLFGVVGVAELHHVFSTFVLGIYTPGVVSAVPFVVFGLMLLHAVTAEYRRSRIRWAEVEPAYQTW